MFSAKGSYNNQCLQWGMDKSCMSTSLVVCRTLVRAELVILRKQFIVVCFVCKHWGYFSAFVVVMMNILVLWWLAARKDSFVVNILVIWILQIAIHIGGNEYDGFNFSEADHVKYMCTYTLCFAWNIYFGFLCNSCLRLSSFQHKFFNIQSNLGSWTPWIMNSLVYEQIFQTQSVSDEVLCLELWTCKMSKKKKNPLPNNNISLPHHLLLMPSTLLHTGTVKLN